ncbi:MAG: hypothetical protein QXP54_06515 [Thermofilum sp.]
MPWVGVSAECPKLEEAEKVLESMGFTVMKKFQLELQVEGAWRSFTVFEVLGFVEGAAELLAAELGCPALESGPHLVLGEVSAKIWDEAAKVVLPEGREVLIPILTYDAFLDLVLPTQKVRGLEGRITITGRTFKLPLTKEDLLEIARLGSKYLEKVEKAIAVYGSERIVSAAALSELLLRRVKLEEEFRYEVDFDEGVAFLYKGGKLTAVSIPRLAVMLAEKGRLEEVEQLFEKCEGELLHEVEAALLDLYSLYGEESAAGKKLKDFLVKRGILKE